MADQGNQGANEQNANAQDAHAALMAQMAQQQATIQAMLERMPVAAQNEQVSEDDTIPVSKVRKAMTGQKDFLPL